MKALLLTALLLTISISVNAKHGYPEPTFCEWLGEAASSVAKNRELGMDEYELIGKFLSKDKSYGEQSVVIPLIDRIYGSGSDLRSNEIAFIEQQRCEVAFVSFRK